MVAIRVCVHYPLNPQKSAECIRDHGHMRQWITQLELPFTDNLNMAAWALTNMTLSGVISDPKYKEVYEQAREKVLGGEKEAESSEDDFRPVKPILNEEGSLIGVKLLQDTPPIVNADRAAMITIKYRD